MSPVVEVPFRIDSSVCDNPTLRLSGSVTEASVETVADAEEGSDGGHPEKMSIMTPETQSKSNGLVCDEVVAQESVGDDSFSLEGDSLLKISCSLSVASENSSIAGEDLLGLEDACEVGTLSSLDIEKNIPGIDVARTSYFGESIADVEIMSQPLAIAVSLEEEIYERSYLNQSAKVFRLPVEKGVTGTVTHSVNVLEVDYVPLWGFTSICGRRPEMEDAVATVPRFLKIPIQMLIGNRVLDGMSKYLTHQPVHFFGVYDGHGGSQVANYCSDRLHLALAEEIEFCRKGIVNGTIKNTCQDQWKKVCTNCFLTVDAEVGGKSVAPETVGSTAVVAIICSSHIIVSNCGDSRAVLCRGKEPMALSVDHKPNRDDEYARIEAAGGKVIQWNGQRVFDVLAMSR